MLPFAGRLANCAGKIVKPEWHLKQIWYSLVLGVLMPLRNEYVGEVPAAPLTTETPDTFAMRPEVLQPVLLVALAVAVALCELWQSPHSLCRFDTPPNSLKSERVCALATVAS